MCAERRSLISEMVLFAMALSERTVRVHPLAKVRENLLSRSITVQRLQSSPFYGLGFADESEDGVGEDGAVAVETSCGDRDVAIR